jgi:hypothetical protein
LSERYEHLHHPRLELAAFAALAHLAPGGSHKDSAEPEVRRFGKIDARCKTGTA